MITLFVHIGAGKCGSSAIQRFLAVNQAGLRDQGILVPGRELDPDDPGVEQHLIYFESGIDRDDFAVQVAGRLRTLARTALEHDCPVAVISAENLINPKQFWLLFRGVEEQLDIRIVAYVRRQDDFMISAWQQWQLKQRESFDEYYRMTKGRIDWHQQLEPWRQSFGRDKMHVRRYAVDKLVDGDVVVDFCQVVGVEPGGLVRPQRLNRSLDERFNDLAHRYRHELFKSTNDHRFYSFVEDLLGEAALKNYGGSSLLTLNQRRRIVDDHAEANRRLRAQYFAHLDPKEALFSEPTEDDVHVPTQPPFDEPTAQRLLDQFFRWADGRSSATVDG